MERKDNYKFDITIRGYWQIYSLLKSTCKTQEEFNEKCRKARKDIIDKYYKKSLWK